ncbi:hypothetical protein [Halarcobacter sp.]|uniref:hypothetical protein n=1 Tax=Halarcobacter sp. TaxID=2321133 RepID=UPI002AA6A5FA|nr:hypothetical protein [Halarcobacter sp.]
MKKILGLSMITSFVLSTSTYADSISEAFDNLEVNGEIKLGFVSSDFLGAAKTDKVTAIGGSLSAVTGSFYGLKAGVTFQAATILSDDTKNNPTNIFSVNNTSYRTSFFDTDGVSLSESYLEYTIVNTTFKAGRQYIHTPIVNNAIEGKSSEAIVKDSFEAYLLTNTDIPDTTLVAGYIDKFQAQNNGNSEFNDFADLEDGAYTLYIKNNSIENLTLQAQYLDIDGNTTAADTDLFYLQADYQAGPHTLSAQYYRSSVNKQVGKMYGLKATGPLGLGKLGYLVGYSSSMDDINAVYTGAGAGATDSVFTALPVHDGEVPARADTDTIVGAIVAPIGPTTIITYAGKSMSNTHVLGDVTGMGAIFIYPITKDLVLKANYAHVDTENTLAPAGVVNDTTDTARIYLSYKF